VKRKGTHRPTIEDCVELSGIETLHPGGMALTQRTGEVTGLRPGKTALDVSTGRGTQAIYYAQSFGVDVIGVDIAPEMLATARARTRQAGLGDRVRFEQGDSQELPFEDDRFDVVINECAVGIPDDSQKVLDEMVRVLRPGGSIAIHESTWKDAGMSQEDKDELAERYGTTPLAHVEWIAMLEIAGAADVQSELEPWSRPEMFWKVRQDREVRHHLRVLSPRELLRTIARVARRYGLRGVPTALWNQQVFYRAVLDGKLGYGLYWAKKPVSS